MTRNYRYRSRSRDSIGNYSSIDRSISRSRSIIRSRRSRSRSYSKSRHYLLRDTYNLSKRRSSSLMRPSKWGRRMYSPDPMMKSDLVYADPVIKDIPNTFKRRPIHNMKWTLPTMGNNHKNNTFNRQPKYHLRNIIDNNYKYESEEFKSQKEKSYRVLHDKRVAYKENRKLLADYSNQLNSLVGELSNIPKDSEEYKSLSDKIKSLKMMMKNVMSPQNRDNGVLSRADNKLDYRETRLLFSGLPDCTKGKGNLAKWISDNAKILLPKEIAMLASCNEYNDRAIIQYKTHSIAEKVMKSCKLHGITVSWAPSTDSITSDTISIDKSMENEVDYECFDD